MILHVAVSGAVAQLRTEGIVVQRLDDPSVTAAVRLPHLTDVPQVVTVVVAEREVVLTVVADVLPCLAVALLEQVLLRIQVPYINLHISHQTTLRQILFRYFLSGILYRYPLHSIRNQTICLIFLCDYSTEKDFYVLV